MKDSTRFLKTLFLRVEALVKQDNIASIRAFEKAGYKRVRKEQHKGVDAIRMRYP